MSSRIKSAAEIKTCRMAIDALVVTGMKTERTVLWLARKGIKDI